jgi:hypothetical protein
MTARFDWHRMPSSEGDDDRHCGQHTDEAGDRSHGLPRATVALSCFRSREPLNPSLAQLDYAWASQASKPTAAITYAKFAMTCGQNPGNRVASSQSSAGVS